VQPTSNQDSALAVEPLRGVDPWQAWRAGISLWQAVHKFPPAAAIAEYRAMRKAAASVAAVNMESFIKALAAMIGHTPDQAITPEQQETLEKGRQADRAFDHLAAAVQNWLRRGALIALGFQKPRKLSDVPQIVPADVWGGIVNWSASTVCGAGIEAIEVRILHPNWIDALNQRKLAQFAAKSEIGPAPKGRPSFKREIVECFCEMKRCGYIDFNAPMKCCFPAIRAALAERFDDRRGQIEGLSDETIRVHVSALFRAARAAKTEKS
jgi:hypothetical protein